VNLGLNILLIPVFGIMGAAAATLLSQVLFFLIIIIYAQKHYPIPYEFGKIVLMILTGLALYLLSLLTDDMSLIVRLLIKSAMLLSWPFILYPFHFYEEIELSKIRGAWEKWKNPGNWLRNFRSMRQPDK
jgi:O-antigen/teichoic acid export membrane protein